MSESPQTISLRPANPTDSWSIRRLIWRARINPLGLDWQRFIVACAPDGRVVGCGQVKTHPDGAKELASIAVLPAWQHQGLATAIIQRLLDETSDTLYLTCRSQLGPFYHRFDFRAIEEAQMPLYFRRISRLVRWTNRFRADGSGLLVMKRPSNGTVIS